MSAQVKPVNVSRWVSGIVHSDPDLLAVEEPLEIRLGFGKRADRKQKSLSVTMRTPGHDFELAIGFLFTERIINSYHHVESVKYCEDVGRQEEKENVVRVELNPSVIIDFNKLQRNFYTTSSCGVCGKSSLEAVVANCTRVDSGLRLTVQQIIEAPKQMRSVQAAFKHTGGLHASGLFSAKGHLRRLREDVGRHNALDKIIGGAVVENQIPLSNSFILVSGRLSFELVQKAITAGVPILLAVGAPSSLAVDLAKKFGITLVGFLKPDKFNIYCNPERILIHS